VPEAPPPNGRPDDPAKRRFLWGVLLAWTPFFVAVLPTIIGIFNAFREISTQKATGLGAVAGGLTEAFATFGLFATVVFEVTALVLLVRAFSKGHPMRTFFSVLSICCSGLMLTILGLFLWLSFRQPLSR
jgi:predicted metal-binding membrane protein